MFSLFTWFWIIYFTVGFLVTFEGIVVAFQLRPDYEWYVKLIGSVLVLICWPLIFFVKEDDDGY